ncbi:MAG: hypothetical protein ABIG85_03940 [Chloroflexota bacterium]
MPFDFLRRGPKKPAVAATSARAGAGSRGIPFDGLTEEWRLVGRMEIEGRLSDVLNRRESIAIADVRWAPVDGSEEMTPAPGLGRIDPFDLIAVFAGAETLPSFTEAERAAYRMHKVTYDVALEVTPYRVVGTVYLFPGSEPERLLDRSTDLFVPVTNAVALLEGRPLNGPDVDVVLVNRSYLRGVDQVDRRTVEATRALLSEVAGERD